MKRLMLMTLLVACSELKPPIAPEPCSMDEGSELEQLARECRSRRISCPDDKCVTMVLEECDRKMEEICR